MSPSFQNQFYSFTIKSTEFGKIGDVLATSHDPDAAIEYSIETENGKYKMFCLVSSATKNSFL